MERLAKERCNRRPVCDRCRRQNIQISAVFWTCWPCDHDLCINCAVVAPIVCLPCGLDPSNPPADMPLPTKLIEALQSEAVALTSLEGWQPLHHAVATGRKKAVLFLLEAKAVPSAADVQGMTPLHLAALLGHSFVVESLLNNKADASALDVKGRPPIALLHAEALRYAFEAEEIGFRETCAHEIKVTGTGPADGNYARVVEGLASMAASEGTGTGTVASPEPPLADGEAMAVDSGGTEDTRSVISPAPGSEVATEVTLGSSLRPTYRRTDGSPFVLKWTERDGWGIFQVRGQESCVFKSSNTAALRCPVDGWAAADGFQMPDGFDGNVQIMDIHPWHAGELLLRATPSELHPPGLRQDVAALLPVQQDTQPQATSSIQLGGGITIPVPPGMLAPGSPSPDQLFQSMMEEMTRRGGPLPMPPGVGGAAGGGTGMMIPGAPGCPQQ